jgi:hypothetical protein
MGRASLKRETRTSKTLGVIICVVFMMLGVIGRNLLLVGLVPATVIFYVLLIRIETLKPK